MPHECGSCFTHGCVRLASLGRPCEELIKRGDVMHLGPAPSETFHKQDTLNGMRSKLFEHTGADQGRPWEAKPTHPMLVCKCYNYLTCFIYQANTAIDHWGYNMQSAWPTSTAPRSTVKKNVCKVQENYPQKLTKWNTQTRQVVNDFWPRAAILSFFSFSITELKAVVYLNICIK